MAVAHPKLVQVSRALFSGVVDAMYIMVQEVEVGRTFEGVAIKGVRLGIDTGTEAMKPKMYF